MSQDNRPREFWIEWSNVGHNDHVVWKEKPSHADSCVYTKTKGDRQAAYEIYHVIEHSAYQSVCERLKQVEGERDEFKAIAMKFQTDFAALVSATNKLTAKYNDANAALTVCNSQLDEERSELMRLKGEALTCPACATTFALGSDLAAVTTDMTELNNQRYAQIVRMAEERDHLRESLDICIEALDGVVVLAESYNKVGMNFLAHNSVGDKVKETLATLRERHKKGDE